MVEMMENMKDDSMVVTMEDYSVDKMVEYSVAYLVALMESAMAAWKEMKMVVYLDEILAAMTVAMMVV